MSVPFRFVVGPIKREFWMHRAIVAAQSPVLDRLVNGEFREAKDLHAELESVDEKTFYFFWQYAYGGDYGDIEPIQGKMNHPFTSLYIGCRRKFRRVTDLKSRASGRAGDGAGAGSVVGGRLEISQAEYWSMDELKDLFKPRKPARAVGQAAEHRLHQRSLHHPRPPLRLCRLLRHLQTGSYLVLQTLHVPHEP